MSEINVSNVTTSDFTPHISQSQDNSLDSGVNTAEKSVLKPYRVTLRTTVDVEIEVEAENERQAEGKACSWYALCPEGSSTMVGTTYYWIDEDDTEHCEEDDDSEMYWEIVSAEFPEPLEIVELEECEEDEK